MVFSAFAYAKSIQLQLFEKATLVDENPEQTKVVLPPSRFSGPRRSQKHKLQEGERVVLPVTHCWRMDLFRFQRTHHLDIL